MGRDARANVETKRDGSRRRRKRDEGPDRDSDAGRI